MTSGAAARVAVITGASGGIGRAVARRLADDGYDLALLDVVAPGAEQIRNLEARGGRVVGLTADVSDEGSVSAASAVIGRELGPVGHLVNAAGIYPRAAALEGTLDVWQRVLAVNLTGSFICCRTFAPDMQRLGKGAIVNFASARAVVGAVRGSHYAASKGGLVGLTRSLALEWAPTIRVNAVMPGLTDTPMPRQSGVSEEELRARAARIPLQRIGSPDDIARVVCFLLGSEAGYVTGQTICVNGGAVMR